MSQLVFGEIIGGAGTRTLVFIPVQHAHELASIHLAITRSKTWREFASSVPARVWADLLQDFEENNGSVPDSKFDDRLLPAFGDGDWPPWPEQFMMQWLPRDLWRQYATVHQSVLNGPFLSIDPKLTKQIVHVLKHAGFTCRRNNLLVKRACGML